MTAPWFKMYSADYLLDRDISMLSMEARGILVTIWCVLHRDKHIPDDVDLVAAIIHADPKVVRRNWVGIRAHLEAGIYGLYSKRMEKERIEYDTKCAKLKENAKAGGKARAKQKASNCSAIANQMSAEVEQNRTEHIYATDSDLAFASLKAIWPKGRINGATLDDLATAGGDPAAIVLAAQAFLADPVACSSEKFAPSLGTWLKDRRFEPYLGTAHDEGPIVTVADPLAVS